MKCRVTAAFGLVAGVSILVSAQGQEFANILRNGQEATLSVFGPRPLELAATKLSGEFGVDVNVEDLFYNFQTTSRVASEEMRLYGPKWRLLETHLNMRPDGRLLDLRQALVDLVDMADAQ
jgi:hypothetical protein